MGSKKKAKKVQKRKIIRRSRPKKTEEKPPLAQDAYEAEHYDDVGISTENPIGLEEI